MIAQIADHSAADLEALFNRDATSLNNGSGGFGDGDQTLEGAAIGKEIIDDPNMLVLVEELLGHDNLILILVGEGLNFSNKHFTVDIDGLGFLCKDQRNAKLLGHKGSNTNAGSLNGQNLVDLLMSEARWL